METKTTVSTGNRQCTDKRLSSVSSREIMKQNGWKFEKLDLKCDSKDCGYDTWYGHCHWTNELGSVSATFDGPGTAILTFGNCYIGHTKTVDVYFNDTKIY